jgi:hypothetical protein
MSDSDIRENDISTVLGFLLESEYGTDDYHLGSKTIVKLLAENIEKYWSVLSDKFSTKQEALYFDIIDRLINTNHEDEEFCVKPAVVAKIIKADSDLVEYCKAQIGVKNNCKIKIKCKFRHKLDFIRKTIELC